MRIILLCTLYIDFVLCYIMVVTEYSQLNVTVKVCGYRIHRNFHQEKIFANFTNVCR